MTRHTGGGFGFTALLVFIAAMFLFGCVQPNIDPRPKVLVPITVQNDLFEDAHIFLVGVGTRQRVMFSNGKSTQTQKLDAQAFPASGCFSIAIQAVAGGVRGASETTCWISGEPSPVTVTITKYGIGVLTR